MFASGGTGFAKGALEVKGKMQKNRMVNYHRENPDNKPREDKKGQWEDGLLEVVE